MIEQHPGGIAARLARVTVASIVRWTGIAFLVRSFITRQKVAILVYHDPAPDLLDRHLDYLAKHNSLLPLDRLVDALHMRDWSSIPPRSVVITFDDGHGGNASLLPAFDRHGVRPSIYVCTQIVGTDRQFWFLAVPDPEPLKDLENDERLRRLEEEYGFTPTRSYADGPQALTLDELSSLRERVDFGSHSRFHAILPACRRSECEAEILDSKHELEGITGDLCQHFSYPNGDYSEREVELVKRAGYASARTMDFGWNDVSTDPFRLKAIHVRDDASVTRLVADLSGVAGFFSGLRRRPRATPWTNQIPHSDQHARPPESRQVA